MEIRLFGGLLALLGLLASAPARGQDAAIDFSEASGQWVGGLVDSFHKGDQVLLALPPEALGLNNEYLLTVSVVSGVNDGLNPYLKSGMSDDESLVVSFVVEDERLRIYERNIEQIDAHPGEDGTSRLRNLPEGVLYETSFKIEPGTGRIIFPATSLLRSGVLFKRMLHQRTLATGSYYVRRVISYPDNLNIRVRHQTAPTGLSRFKSPSPIDIEVQYSLLRMPKEGFEMRKPDVRVGYFTTRKITALSKYGVNKSHSAIQRWRLEPKDPSLALSEPKEPIVFYVENTIPQQYRAAIREGVLIWNEAFEGAGFKNAIEVRDQPEDAKWDADDINYNVIRWVRMPEYTANFSQLVVNPRTGEILSADVVLSDEFFDASDQQTSLVDGLMAPSEVASLETESPAVPETEWRRQEGASFANTQSSAVGPEVVMDLEELSRRSVQRLLWQLSREGGSDLASTYEFGFASYLSRVVAHEVGHALGLRHNFAGSNAIPLSAITEADSDDLNIVSSSVMDYTNPFLVKTGSGIEVVDLNNKTGAYDRWAIEFGYRQNFEDAAAEASWRDAHLARAGERDYWYGSDGFADSRFNADDMTDDPVGFVRHQFALLDEIEAQAKQAGNFSMEEPTAYMDMLLGVSQMRFGLIYPLTLMVGGQKLEILTDKEGQQGWYTSAIDGATQQEIVQLVSETYFHVGFDDLPTNTQMFRAQNNELFAANLPDPRVTFLVALMGPRAVASVAYQEERGSGYTVESYLSDIRADLFDPKQFKDTPQNVRLLQQFYLERLQTLAFPPVNRSNPNVGVGDDVVISAKRQMKELYRELGRVRPSDELTRAHVSEMRQVISRQLAADRSSPGWLGQLKELMMLAVLSLA